MINASHVKDLREKTGAGMMDCKRALVETNGDFDAAIDLLRTKGLANAANKAGRIAAEGLVSAVVQNNVGVVVEINSETDFVALNDTFQNMVKSIGKTALLCEDIEQLKLSKLANGRTVQEEIMENVATIGENLSLRRMSTIRVNEGIVASYIHNSTAENVGKIAVIVGLESKGDIVKLSELGKQIAMHIAATRPQSLTQQDIDPALVAKEREIFIEQSRSSGKPDNIIEKMVDGRIRKFFEEVVLLDQTFVIDGKSKISELLTNVGRELNETVAITKFIRYEVGEGIVQEKKNFADEVAAVIK